MMIRNRVDRSGRTGGNKSARRRGMARTESRKAAVGNKSARRRDGESRTSEDSVARYRTGRNRAGGTVPHESGPVLQGQKKDLEVVCVKDRTGRGLRGGHF